MPRKQTFFKRNSFFIPILKLIYLKIIAYIIKIQAIKICHDYNNNLA